MNAKIAKLNQSKIGLKAFLNFLTNLTDGLTSLETIVFIAYEILVTQNIYRIRNEEEKALVVNFMCKFCTVFKNRFKNRKIILFLISKLHNKFINFGSFCEMIINFYADELDFSNLTIERLGKILNNFEGDVEAISLILLTYLTRLKNIILSSATDQKSSLIRTYDHVFQHSKIVLASNLLT